MRICLVRHGQSEWQQQREGDLDGPLTALGCEQSRRVAQWLAEHRSVDSIGRIDVAAIHASPFRRAQHTAFYAAEALRLPIITQSSLSEADFHVADCLPAAKDPLATRGAYRPPAAYACFKAQAQSALQELIVESGKCGSILAVSHGALIKTVLRVVLGSDHVCFQIYNTAVNVIEWKAGRWHLIHLNLCDHLPPELRTW